MNFLQDKFLNFFVNFLNHNTEKKLLHLSRLFKLIAYSDQSKHRAGRMHWLFKTKHPFCEWWQRVFRDLNPVCKKKFFHNYFINVLGGKYQKQRNAFEKIHGYPPPAVLITSMTKDCNFKCTGCWARKYKVEEELPYEKWKEIMTEAKEKMGINFFYVAGGEPFMRKDLLKLAEDFPECLFFTYTNASLLTDKKIDEIKRLGNVYPMVSLNGYKKQNDALRGEGTYEMVLEKLDKLKQAGIFFGTSLTATKQNAEEVVSYDFLKMLSDKGSFWCWVFNCSPIGEEDDMKLLPTPEQRVEIYKSIVHARNTMPMLTYDVFGDSMELGGCTVGRRVVHINVKGDVEPCPLIHLATHNLKEHTLTEALSSPLIDAFRKDVPFEDANMLRPCVVIDRPEILEEYIRKYEPYETHDNATGYLTNPETRRKLFEYSKRAKELLDKNWSEKKYMGLYPEENQWYYDKEYFCGFKKPLNGKHGGGYPGE